MTILEKVLSVLYFLTCRTWRRGENCTLQIYWVFKKKENIHEEIYIKKQKSDYWVNAWGK